MNSAATVFYPFSESELRNNRDDNKSSFEAAGFI